MTGIHTLVQGGTLDKAHQPMHTPICFNEPTPHAGWLGLHKRKLRGRQQEKVLTHFEDNCDGPLVCEG